MSRVRMAELAAWNAAQDRAKRAYYGAGSMPSEDAIRRANAAQKQADYRRRKKEEAS